MFRKPNLARSEHSLLDEADLVEFVVVTASQKSALLRNDLETPAFTVVVTGGNELLISALDVDCDNSAIIVADKDLSIQEIHGGCVILDSQWNLTNELKLTTLS